LELRAILGVPGAFRFSDPLALPDATSRVRVAPGQDFALIERRNADPAALVLNAGAVDHSTPLTGVLPAADWVTFSAGGASAVLFSARARRMQLVTGLPDAPRIALDLDAAALAGAPHSAAVSDDGKLLLIAAAQSVFAVPPDGPPQLVFSGSAVQGIAILPNAPGAVIADGGSLYLWNAGAGARVVVSGLDGLTAIAPSADGSAVYVAREGFAALSVIDLATGEVREFESAIAPLGLTPLRSRDTFLISATAGQPGWIFYRDGSEGRTVFIPAVPGEAVRQPRGGAR
jgi:hypothetical protein